MKSTCITKKNQYPTQELAEEVLIELWTKNDYHTGQAPIAVYRCEDCGSFHLTSKGEMNPVLAKNISDKQHSIRKEASRWLDKFKKR